MSDYDLRTAEGRDEMRQERLAEMDAILNGTWPRSATDMVRWTDAPTGVTQSEYAKRMVQADLAYLNYCDARDFFAALGQAVADDPVLMEYTVVNLALQAREKHGTTWEALQGVLSRLLSERDKLGGHRAAKAVCDVLDAPRMRVAYACHHGVSLGRCPRTVGVGHPCPHCWR